MHKHPLNQCGFAHYIVVVGVVTLLGIGAVFGAVLKAQNNANVTAAQQKAVGSAKARSSVGSDTTSQSKAETVNENKLPEKQTTPVSLTANKAPTTTVAIAPTSTNSNPTVNNTAPNISSSPAPAPGDTYQNELYELTNIISDFQNNVGNNTINITSKPVTVAGPVSNATAQPVVFGNDKLLVKTYFAYMQNAPINFAGSASTIASKMAIVTAGSSYATQSGAYINKSGNLQDTTMSTYLIGYSAGGN